MCSRRLRRQGYHRAWGWAVWLTRGNGAEVLGGLEVVFRLSGGQQTRRDPAADTAAHERHSGLLQGQALLLRHGHVSRVYQIEIEEEARPKTSFVTPDCQCQYRRLPFGFASSSATFQRRVDMLLGGMKWIFAIGYIDDIIVYSDTWAHQFSHLKQLFEALRKANLQLHARMCFRGPGGEAPGAFGDARRDPGLSQQGQGHRGDAQARERKGGAEVHQEMPVLPQVYTELLAGRGVLIQGTVRPARLHLDRCLQPRVDKP